MHRYLILFVLLLSACQPVNRSEQGFSVQYHPDGGLFVGDRVSIEVIPLPGWEGGDHQVKITVGDKELGSADFQPSGVGQRDQATFYWVWDTTDLEPGEQTLSYTVLPDGPSWQEEIQLQPAARIPFSQAKWVTTKTQCCILAYITGTDAERDIVLLKQMVEDQAALVNERMQIDLKQPISITFIPRLLGHGGFVSNGIYVTYLDENIVGNTTRQVIHHEMVHALDRSLEGKEKPSLLVEGLAVYLSGGHFKSEALLPRAAVLLELNTYIPLKNLVENFYFEQHEIGYLEAGALVEYMVERYGWDEFQSFYRNIEPAGDGAESLMPGLNEHFEISMEQLEKDFLNELRVQVVTEDMRNDLQLNVTFYENLRLYQEVLDPSAYFLTAWFPDGDTMRKEGIVADFLRSPSRLDNFVFEFLLRTASKKLSSEDQKQAEMILETVNFLLSLYPQALSR